MDDQRSRWLGFVDSLLRRPAGGRPSCGDLALFPERNPGPVLLVARDGRPLYSNPAARRELDLTTAPERVSLPGELGERLERMWASGIPEGVFEYSAGARILSCRILLLPERQVAHVYLADVTDTRSAERQLAHARGHDSLTGLGNRVAFEARLEQALLDRPDGRVVVLVLNLDRLRRVNETLGHAAGDLLLREAASRLHRAARGGAPGGEAFRLDGDSFALLLATAAPDASPARLAKAVQASLGEPFGLAGQEVFVTASLGIAVAPADGGEAAALLRAAEAALDQVKQHGGNGFRCYAPDLDSMAREFLEVESALHRALERDEFFLVYQTQVELRTRREAGREALLRWRHPRHGIVPPARFIPVAEETGLIGPIGEWASLEACRAAAGWGGTREPAPRVAVNVAARQLHDPRFCDGIVGMLAGTGLPPARLEIEITESTAMADPGAAAGTLRRLQAMGVGIAIDDFGTGYSSLSYLARFPASRIKIDRSFVQGIGREPEAEGITRAVIEVAHRLGMRVVAEGVETEEQAEALRDWGCEEAQGFLFGLPLEDALCAAAAWARR